MHGHHNETIPSAVAATRLDRRRLLRRSAVGFAVPAALALAGMPAGSASAQSSDATPASSPASAAGQYASVNGLNMYYEIHGTGEPLVMLHGGFATIDLMFGQLLPALAQTRQVIAAELQGHGHTADIDRPIGFASSADDIAALMAHLGVDQTDIFGYSLGGGVALQTAIRHPELVRKLVVSSTPFKNDGWYPEVLAGMGAMTPEVMTQTPLYEAYLQVAPKPEDWPALVTKIRHLLTEEVYDWTTDIVAIEAPTLIIVADSDSVRPAHTQEMFQLLGGGVPGDFVPLPPSQLAVVPGTSHSSMLLARSDLLVPIIVPFLDAPMPEGQ